MIIDILLMIVLLVCISKIIYYVSCFLEVKKIKESLIEYCKRDSDIKGDK